MALDPRDALDESKVNELMQAALEFSDLLRERIAKTTEHGFKIDVKADETIVTNADVDAEESFRQAVMARFRAHGVKGEEFPTLNPDAEFLWVVDPIDGTAEFAAGVPVWGTIIGLNYRDHPIAGVIDLPMLQLRAWAGYGLGAFLNGRAITLEDLPGKELTGKERIGSPSVVNYMRHGGSVEPFKRLTEKHPNLRIYHTCLTHVMAASGGLDAAIEWSCPLWDVAATRILVEEAGGRYECLKTQKGEDGEQLFNVVFGRPSVVQALHATLHG